MNTRSSALFLIRLALIAVFAMSVSVAWAGRVSLNNSGSEYYALIPASGTDTLIVYDTDIGNGKGVFKIYDNGGSSGNYSNNVNGILAVKIPKGHGAVVSGSIVTEGHYDQLKITRRKIQAVGSATTTLLDTTSGSTTIGPLSAAIYSSGQQYLIFTFTSDGSSVFSGIDLTVTIMKNDTLSKGDDAYYVNLPMTGRSNLTITDSLIDLGKGGYFKVYDHGGMSGNYSCSSNGILRVSAPTGYTMKIFGSIESERGWDRLRIYGSSESDIYLSDTSGTMIIDTVSIPGNVANIRFKSDGSNVDIGFDLTVLLVKNVSPVADGNGGFYINMPGSGAAVYNVSQSDISQGKTRFTVYDNGGKNGNYKDFTQSYLQITAPEGGNVNLIVYKPSLYSPDSVAIYDGALGNTNRRAYSTNGSYSSLYFYKTYSRYATFIQGTNGTSNYTGFEIEVAVDNPVGISATSCGTVTSSKEYAVVGETVTMTATPKKGCALDSVDFKLGMYGIRTMDANVDVGNWWSTGTRTFSFTMPADTVDVVAYFSEISASNEKAINMPKAESRTFTIPDGVSSFRVYDHGGRDGTYDNYAKDTLILQAPSGYVLNLSGKVFTENCCDYLSIYDGSSTSSTLLKTVRGEGQDVGSVYSSGEYLTLTFKSDYSQVSAGLDLMVRVSKKTASHNVVALSPGNNFGTITVSPTTATMGTTITVSATPSTDYKFVGVMLTNDLGDTISVIENTAGGNSLTFPMDFDGIKVKPYFATQQMGFDSYGCLSDGWYFRFKDGVLTQGSIIPDVGANVDNCWFKKVGKINSRALTTMKAPIAPSDQYYYYYGLWFELEEATSITLGGDLDFGGAVNGTCQMDFRPLAPKTLTGNGHKIKNFCMTGTDVGFFDNANATVKNVIFEDPYLVATSKAGIIGPSATGSSTIQNVTVTGGTIQGEIAGALIGEVSYNTTLSYISVSGATVRGRVAGGMVGNVGSGYTLSLYNTSTTRNSVSGTTVSAYYANGFTAGSAYAGGVVGNGSVSFSNPLPLLSDNTVTAENSIGSDWNVYLGGYVGYQGSSTSPLKGGQATGMTISSQANANAAVYAGGYFGYVNGSLNLWQSGFDGAISGADYAGGLVGAVAKTSASTTLNIVNTYSTGSISGSGSVGYIVGGWTASNGVTLPGTGDAIYNNYHFGTDEIDVGIGGYSPAGWAVGSDYVYDNVRNATGSLDATDLMRLYRYSDLCAETYHVTFFPAYFDMTAAAPSNLRRNGIATEADMKSDKFVALLNENRADAWGDSVWFISDANNGLPLPTSHVQFRSNANAMFGSYVTVELATPTPLANDEDYGFYDYSYYFCNTAGNTGSATRAMVGWTKSDGTLSSDFVTAVNTAATAAATNTTYIVDNSGYSVDMSAAAFLPGARLRIFEPSESYAVTYKYCPTQNSCEFFENISDVTFLFLSPQVSTVLVGLENTSFVPYVIALDNQSGVESDLVMSIDYLDNVGSVVGSYGGSGAVSGFMTFGSVLSDIGTNPDVRSILITYSPSADVPKITVSNTTAEGFYVDVYPYDATAPLQARQAQAGNASVDIPYGVSFKVRDFDEKIGYTHPSYSAKLSIVVDDANACIDFTDLGTEDGDMNFAPWEEMLLDACYTKSWNVTGLTDDATLGLEEIKKAILNNTQSVFQTAITVTPQYNAIPYDIVFDTTRWQYLKGASTYSDFVPGSLKYEMYVPADFYAPSYYDLDLANRRLPEFHAVTQEIGDGMGVSVSYVGFWTYDSEANNCEIGTTGDASQYDVYANGGGYTCAAIPPQDVELSYGSFTPSLIDNVTNAGLLNVSNTDGINSSFTLYPVWYYPSDDRNYVYVGCEATTEYDCSEVPLSFTLSQSFTMGGLDYVLTHKAEQGRGDTVSVPLPMNRGADYVFDVAVSVNPGFDVDLSGVSFEAEEVNNAALVDYDATNATLTVYNSQAHNNVVLKNSGFSFVDYEVTFDISSLNDNVVALGSGSVATKTMNLSIDGRTFPDVYALSGNFDHSTMRGLTFKKVYWSAEAKKATDFANNSEWQAWLDTSAARRLTSKLIGAATGGDASQTSFDLFPVSGTDVETGYIGVRLYSENGPTFASDSSEFHGHVVLSQPFGSSAVVQKSDFGTPLGEWEGILFYPKVGTRVFEYDVSVDPDPGYNLEIESGVFDSEFGVYNATDNKLVVRMNLQFNTTPYFVVKPTRLNYNLAFSRPEPDTKLYVANQYDENTHEYSMNWLESEQNVNVEDAVAPRLYNSGGCRIGWKVDVPDGSPVDNVNDVELRRHFAYMVPRTTETDETTVNSLVPDLEDGHEVCEKVQFYTLTLHYNGEGTFKLVQKLGAEPQNEGDPAQTVIEHAFSYVGPNTYELQVPKMYDDAGHEAGVTLTVDAIPGDGLSVKKITYSFTHNGNIVNALMENGASLNVMQDMEWNVEFAEYDPVYITYDLSLENTDASYVWVPADAFESGYLEVASDGSAYTMWKPYNTDKCFAGWSMLTASEYATAIANSETPTLYTDLSTLNHKDFSTDALNPTKLYAVWTGNGGGCTTTDPKSNIQLGYYDNGTYVEMSGYDSLVVTQTFGNAVLTHKGASFNEALLNNSAGYRVNVQIGYGLGYEQDESMTEMKVSRSYVDATNGETVVSDLTPEADGSFVIGNFDVVGATVTYNFGHAEKPLSYDVTFNTNADGKNVFFGENWSAYIPSERSIRDTSFNWNVFRTDACFKGWSFDPNAAVDANNVSRKITEDFVREYVAVKASGAEAVLYAIWNEDVSSCLVPLENVTVTIADGLKSKATVELVQEVDGSDVVVAVVGDDGILVPKESPHRVDNAGGTDVIGDYIYFNKLFVIPALGYDIDNTVPVTYQVGDAAAVEVVDGMAQWSMLENTVVSGSMRMLEYALTFDVNASQADVFYPVDWIDSKTYNFVDNKDEAFPKVYRTDKCLVGYGLYKDASREESFEKFDERFKAAYDSVYDLTLVPPSKLYAVWNECSPAQTLYTVTLNDFAEGVLTLVHNGKNYEVPSNGFRVPASVTGIKFAVSFNVNAGYELDANGTFNVVDATGAVLGEFADDTLLVDGDKIVDAPVNVLENTFAFDVNAGDATVFYGADWVESAQYSLGAANVDFPMGVYRVGACLAGWSLNAEGNKAYLKFDTEFAAAVESAKGMGLPVNVLYAVWGDCSAQTIAMVKNDNASAGTFTLRRVVSRTTSEYTVAGNALAVPADEPLAFNVAYSANAGYTYDATAGVSAVDTTGAPVTMAEDTVTVAGGLTLTAAVTVNAYTFALAENAGSANVFYTGTLKSEFSATVTDDVTDRTFPTNFYRSDACLVGWNFNAGATTGFTLLDSGFVAVYDSIADARGAAPTTLYAVWNASCSQTVVVVALADADKGTLTLSQGDGRKFTVDSIIKVPQVQGGIEFTTTFAPVVGYTYDASQGLLAYDLQSVLIAPLTTGALTVDQSIVVAVASLTPTVYNLAFVENAGDAKVFYGDSWRSGTYQTAYSLESAGSFPMDLYRTDACLNGWALTDAPDAVGFRDFSDAFVREVSSVAGFDGKVYAKWGSCLSSRNVKVSQVSSEAGVMTLAQVDANGRVMNTTAIAADTATLPLGNGDVTFVVSFTVGEGYSLVQNGYFYTVSGRGVNLRALEDDMITLADNTILRAPILSDGVEFVFNENNDGNRVFYENGWRNTGFYTLGGEAAFPYGILRTDANLLGWSLSRTSTKYYKKYDQDFVNDLRDYRNLGMPADTLYAVWDTYALVENVTVKSDNDRNGVFVLTQTVNGVETEPLEVTGEGVQIPKSDKGLAFNVNFDIKPGYYLNSESPLSNVSTAGDVLESFVNGGSMTVGMGYSSTLRAAVAATQYQIKYNVNGGNANVFYGDTWSSVGKKTLDDESVELPKNIYRSDACLEGWSTSADATEGTAVLDSGLVLELAEQGVNTLYAVWRECEVETYKVTFANTNVGSLVLTQDVEDSVVSFNVEEAGLDVPVVGDGLRFRAAYTLKAGYSGSTDSLYVVDDISGLLKTLADNSLTVNEDVTLAIPTEGKVFPVAFDVNTTKKELFYGNDWMESANYMLNDSTSVIPLPAYVYTVNSCVVGWAVPGVKDSVYTQFSSNLAGALLTTKTEKGFYKLQAVWGKGDACLDAYDRIVLKTANGMVKFVEVATGDKAEDVVHVFGKDSSMILPKTMNGNNLRVISVADSSFILDSLVLSREGSDERQVFYEGDPLVYNLRGASFQAYFGKSNRNGIEIVSPTLAKAGNAIRLTFTTNDFEVTRGVKARVILETEAGKSVAKETLTDSIVLPYSGVWEKFPLAAGDYVLTLELSDDKETADTTIRFTVESEIATLSADSWQMVSLGNLDKKAMKWDDDAKFYWWDESSASGEYWQYKEYNPKKDEIVATRGYWYSSLGGRPLILKSKVEEKMPEKVEWKLDSINSGWNLVANPYGFALDLYGDHPADKKPATEKSNIAFWRWNTDAGRYDPATVLKEYEAVWVQVKHAKTWTIPVRPDFDKEDDSDTVENEQIDESGAQTVQGRLSRSHSLVKANGTNDWRIQAMLSDARGHRDTWNMLGASTSPFVDAEPPEGMGDHVNLSIVEGGHRLAKSVKAPAEEQEWALSLGASSERVGYLTFAGVADLNALGLKVFVTVDGRTTEMTDGKSLEVALKSSATKATVRVAKTAKVAANLQLAGLRSTQYGNSLKVRFDAGEGLAGSRSIVEIVGMDGHVVARKAAGTLAGVNAFVFDAPRTGMYMIRVRAGSQMQAGRILVK